MEFTQEQIEEIEMLAGINYTVRQIALYFKIPAGDLHKEFNNKESEFRKFYDRGKLISQAQIDMQTLQSAKGGNMTAMQQIEKVRNARHFETMRDQLIYGNE